MAMICFRVVPANADALDQMKTVKSKYEDTLLDIARVHDLGFVEIRAANPDIDPWLPGDGTEITIPAQHLYPNVDEYRGIIVNLSEMRLYYFPDPQAYGVQEEDDKTIVTFPIGIGREGYDTPVGETKISWRRSDPTWRPTPDMHKENPNLPEEVPAGPDNPLGSHAVYMQWPNYLFHGTSKPWGIGRRVSSGCIRLYPEDIEKLFTRARKDTLVQIVDQPIKMGWIDDGFYLEASPRIEELREFEAEGSVKSYDIDEGFLRELNGFLGQDVIAKLDWIKIRQIIQDRKGYPIKIYHKEDKTDKANKVEKAES